MSSQLAKDSLSQPKISKAKKNKKFGKSPKLKVINKFVGKSTYSPRTTKKKVEDKPKSKRAV